MLCDQVSDDFGMKTAIQFVDAEDPTATGLIHHEPGQPEANQVLGSARLLREVELRIA